MPTLPPHNPITLNPHNPKNSVPCPAALSPRPLTMTLSTLLLTLLLSATFSCDDLDLQETTNDKKLVVEGWIENGGYPVVMLTRSLPISLEEQDLSDLSEYLDRWAKVTVSDGTNTVVLTGRYDKDYYPSYIYTSTRIKGEVGKTYTLTIDDGRKTYTAETSIPAPAHIDSIAVERVETNDSLCQVFAYVSRQQTPYFHFFVCDSRFDGYYMTSFLGAFSNEELPETGCRKLQVNNHRRPLIDKDYNTAFSNKALLSVRISAMNKTAYNFWQTYEKNMSLSQNPIFPVSENLPSNIPGAFGYWIGYGSTEYQVSMPIF